MGFPMPLTEWVQGPLREFVLDTFETGGDRRPYLASKFDPRTLVDREARFARNLWGLLALEIWQQTFHDRAAHWRALGAELKAPIDAVTIEPEGGFSDRVRPGVSSA
jgi:asparagine synthase (glutamine-hydrolysing)